MPPGLTSTLTDRRRHDLEARSAALRLEFDHWRRISEAGQPFERHNSQIRRIVAWLGGVLDQLTGEIAALTSQSTLTRAVQVEEKQLAAHLVWEFFRSRIALRADDHLRPYLRLCDDFVFDCWRPFRDLLGGHKEPPLVFLNGGWSPFAVSRDVAFSLDRPGLAADGQTVGWLDTGEFDSVMKKLPVPMIGVPWFQVCHLPDALVLGHETGHIIETDFGLTASLTAAIEAVTLADDRRQAWHAWQREVFADVFGCLAGGPRFAAALMDFIAADPQRVAVEQRVPSNWTRYPSRWMRVALMAETLRAMGLARAAEALSDSWAATYQKQGHNQEFAADIPAIVAAVLHGPYEPLTSHGKHSLTDVLTFRHPQGTPYDETMAEALTRGGSTQDGNPRELVAAARILFQQSPQDYDARKLADKVQRAVEQAAPKGVRGTRAVDLDAVLAEDARTASL
jgi:hypothetical protein